MSDVKVNPTRKPTGKRRGFDLIREQRVRERDISSQLKNVTVPGHLTTTTATATIATTNGAAGCLKTAESAGEGVGTETRVGDSGTRRGFGASQKSFGVSSQLKCRAWGTRGVELDGSVSKEARKKQGPR